MPLVPYFAALAYLVSAAIGARTFMAAEDRNPLAPRLLALVAVLLHTGYHAMVWPDARGADLHFFAALSLVGLGMAGLSTIIGWQRNLDALGVVVYPLAVVTLLLYHHFGHARTQDLDWRLLLHAWLALLAYATLAIGAVLAILLWVQERALRRRRLGPWLRALPPLTQTEALLFGTLWTGFVLLSATLLSGALFVHDLLSQHLWHKTVLSVLSWIVFGVLLLGRWRYGWRGGKAVRLTLVAMGLLLLAFFGSKFVQELLLNYR
ncbi:cytochrome C assembly family protein [Coralloluteibacterium thermophilus]|uniref:Inner membrane protein YpjD n=1 Tax=Coralloluteibacterium thermophilum TaxID=2707049 RepID=A0ABV9NFR9_9GAMM